MTHEPEVFNEYSESLSSQPWAHRDNRQISDASYTIITSSSNYSPLMTLGAL